MTDTPPDPNAEYLIPEAAERPDGTRICPVCGEVTRDPWDENGPTRNAYADHYIAEHGAPKDRTEIPKPKETKRAPARRRRTSS
jgi:hypothetical protein